MPIKQGGKSSLDIRSSVLGGQRPRWRPEKGALGSMGAPRGPSPCLQHLHLARLPRSCGGAGKRRGLASGARVIGCPGPLARAVWSSPGGEGRSGHCSNHRHHHHSRSRRSLGRLASSSERRLPGRPDADRDAALCSLRARAMPGSRA